MLLQALAKKRTLPLSVVAANSLASAVAFGVDNMECVVFHASGLKTQTISLDFSPRGSHAEITYGLLELLEVLMSL